MKRELTPGIIAVIAIVVLVAIGAWAWRNFAPPTARAGKNPYEGNMPAGMKPGVPPPDANVRYRGGPGPSGGGAAPYGAPGGGAPSGSPYGGGGGMGAPPGAPQYGQPPPSSSAP